MYRSNAFVTASVGGTLLIYVMRWLAADTYDGWRCPLGAASAVLFAGAQVAAVVGMTFKISAVAGIRRRHDEPPATCPLMTYLFVSVTSAVMLGFALLWAGGILPAPRCLSGSTACLRLEENLEQTTGWLAAALIALMLCQVAGGVGAARSLRCCGCMGEDDAARLASIRPVMHVDLVDGMPVPQRSFEGCEGNGGDVVEAVVVPTLDSTL
jgi:hypothetical protein